MDHTEPSISCPIDGTAVPLGKKMFCPTCGEDLAGLGRMSELPLAYYNEGLKLATQGKIAEALEKLGAAVALKPDFAKPLVVMGKLYAQKGMYPDALACWERIREHPADDTVSQAISRVKALMAQKIPAADTDVRSSAPALSEVSLMASTAAASPWTKVATACAAVTLVLVIIWLGIWYRQLPSQFPGPEVSAAALSNELAGLRKELFDLAEQNRQIALEMKTCLASLKMEQQAGQQKTRIETTGERVAGASRPADYVVQPGDTLNNLAARFLGSANRWPDLMRLNADVLAKNPNLLRIGQKLRIPSGSQSQP